MNPVPVPARDGDHVGEVNEVRNRSQILSDISPIRAAPGVGEEGKPTRHAGPPAWNASSRPNTGLAIRTGSSRKIYPR